jgi:predicted nucleic acid-binding protein
VRLVDTSASALDLAQACRSAGVTAPTADVVIAACAFHYGMELEHRDEHFTSIKAAWASGGR